MDRDKPEPTLRFGASKVTQTLLDYYISKGFFRSGECQPPQDEEIPNPQEGECVVFHDFFTVGLRFPLDAKFPEIFDRFNVKMHHLTPNAVIQLSRFFWVLKTFAAPVSVDTFCRFYELHPQGRKISFEDDEEVYSAQSGCCTFIPQRGNKVLHLDHVEISFSQKNKWDDDRCRYWFYAKVEFPGAEGVGGGFSLASKVELFAHRNPAAFDTLSPGFVECEAAFRLAAKSIGCRDFVEYLAAKVWPLTSG
ncbi:putative retrotransposon protein [Panicum miliaceum]|uniref:Retrotransposon protein n=1 Tax=Panicum miliaceum TaxID=4540 RepID=A0A3L6RHE0_PANMI|nr:putative retrotransposon protein [Panicum miliaceum]